MTAPNPYKAMRQTEKTWALADAASAAGLSAEAAPVAPVTLRVALAAAAGVHAPSDETWARVVSILERRERLADVDPFDGLVTK